MPDVLRHHYLFQGRPEPWLPHGQVPKETRAQGRLLALQNPCRLREGRELEKNETAAGLVTTKREAKEITPRQQEVLDFIIQSIEEQGFPPTLREIAKRFGFTSTRAASDHLMALERKGWINRSAEGGSRAITLLRHRVVVEAIE